MQKTLNGIFIDNLDPLQRIKRYDELKNNVKYNDQIVIEKNKDIFEDAEKELKGRDIKKQIIEISDRISDLEILFISFQKELFKINKKIEKIKKKGEE